MFYFKLIISVIILIILCTICRSSPINVKDGWVRVNKCCEPNEVLIDLRCADANETGRGTDLWSPIFTSFDDKPNAQVPGFWFAIGIPQCTQKQMWPIYYYPGSRDRLALLPDGTLRHYIQNNDDSEPCTDSKYRWPNKIVPYRMTLDHSRKQRKQIEKAFRIIESVSCVRFLRRTDEPDYVQIQAEGKTCFSKIGRHGKEQILNLGAKSNKCSQIGTILHELLHVLGFHHMQSTWDRDDYVTINWENIRHGKKNYNFQKYTNDEVSEFGVPYDYDSVMHYSRKAFSRNKHMTVVPKDPKYIDRIGQRIKLSDGDIMKLNEMYDCYNHHRYY